MTDHDELDEEFLRSFEQAASELDLPEWQAKIARDVALGGAEVPLLLPPRHDASLLSFSDRVAANKTPAHRYPSSVKVHGRWQDKHPRTPPTVDIEPEQLEAEDRRWIGIVALVIACMIAAGLLLFWIAPARDPHPCPLVRTTPCGAPVDARMPGR